MKKAPMQVMMRTMLLQKKSQANLKINKNSFHNFSEIRVQ
jgi:hypothetical protein